MGRAKWKPYSGFECLDTLGMLLSSSAFSVRAVDCPAVIEEVIGRILCILKLDLFILSWGNEVIIHWTTVLLKWVSSLKLLHHVVHIVWWTGGLFFFIYQLSSPPVFTFPSLLPAFLFCVIKWMWKPGVIVSSFAKGWSCLELFFWIYFIGVFLIKSSQQPRCLSEM